MLTFLLRMQLYAFLQKREIKGNVKKMFMLFLLLF